MRPSRTGEDYGDRQEEMLAADRAGGVSGRSRAGGMPCSPVFVVLSCVICKIVACLLFAFLALSDRLVRAVCGLRAEKSLREEHDLVSAMLPPTSTYCRI